MGNSICLRGQRRKSSVIVEKPGPSDIVGFDKLPEASAPPGPELVDDAGKMSSIEPPPARAETTVLEHDGAEALVAAKMRSIEPMTASPAQAETVQPEMEPEEESPSTFKVEEKVQEASQSNAKDSEQIAAKKEEDRGSDPTSGQAFYQGLIFSPKSNSLRCCEGGSLSPDGFEISSKNSYQSAAAFSTSKVGSFTVEVVETQEYCSEGMILGFTKVDVDTAISKVSRDDCEAHDLGDTWCVTEKSVKLPTQLILIDWHTREAKKGDKVTIYNANGDFRIDLNGTNVYCLPNVLPREPMTAVIQPRGVHFRVRVG